MDDTKDNPAAAGQVERPVRRLAADVARCDGHKEDGEFREGCDDCLRRTSPRPFRFVVAMQPPPLVVFECEARIAPWA